MISFMAAFIWVCVLLMLSFFCLNHRKRFNSIFELSARELNLNLFTSLFLNPEIKGIINDQEIRIKVYKEGRQRIARIQLQAESYFPVNFEITQRSDVNRFTHLMNRKIKTGDPGFDNTFLILSEEEIAVIALMPGEIREIFKEMKDLFICFKIDEQNIDATFFFESITSYKHLTHIIKIFLKLCQSFCRKINYKQALIQSIRDSLVSVQKNNMQLLLKYYKQDSEIEDLLLELIKEQDPELKFLAASNLGAIGAETLYQILKAGPAEMQAKVVQAIIRSTKGACISPLANRYHHLNDKARLIMLKEFRELADTKASPFLVGLMERGTRVRLAVVRALETCGELEAVEPLYLLVKKVSTTPVLKTAAARSIAAIQARAGKGEKGWLSLSGLETGYLAFTENPIHGRLSIKKEKEN